MSKKIKKTGRSLHDGFYALVPAFDPTKTINGKVPNSKDEFVVYGAVSGVLVVTVPDDVTDEERNKLGAALAAQGITSIVASNKIKFMRVRRCGRREEEWYRAEIIRTEEEASKARASALLAAAQERSGDGVGSIVDGDGDRDLPDGRDAGSRGDGEHREGDGDQATHADP